MDKEFSYKTSDEEQMEMMMMMMQVERRQDIPKMEFVTINQELNMDTSAGVVCNNDNINPVASDHFHVNSPAYLLADNASCGESLSFWQPGRWQTEELPAAGTMNEEQKLNSMAAMREMIFRIAAMQPIHIDPESVKPPKRKNVKISTDPQSVAARHRREKISERIRILQRLVPGGTKMDTASMLDEAIHYVKFLKNQVQSLEKVAANGPPPPPGIGFPVPMTSGNYFPVSAKDHHHHIRSSPQNVQHFTYP